MPRSPVDSLGPHPLVTFGTGNPLVFRVFADDRRDRLGEPIALFEVSHLIDVPSRDGSFLLFLFRGSVSTISLEEECFSTKHVQRTSSR
jgi:hypothetical protein